MSIPGILLALPLLLPVQGPNELVLPLELELPEGYDADGFRVRAVRDPGEAEAAASRRDLGLLGRLRRDETGFAAVLRQSGATLRPSDAWRMHLTSEDGLWWGSAVCSPEQRARGERIPIRLTSTGCLELTTTDATGHVRPPGGDLQIGGYTGVTALLHPLDRPDARPLRYTTTLYTRATFGAVPPGRYRVVVDSQRMASQERVFEVRAGDVTPVRLELEPLELGTIAGRIVTRSGGGEIVWPTVTFRGLEPPHRTFKVDVGQNCIFYDGRIVLEEDDSVGRFTLAGVPMGEYVVEASALHHHPWPVRAIAAPGGPPLVFTLLDDERERGFRMWAVDARTDATLPMFWLAPAEDDPLFPLPKYGEPGQLLAPAALDGARFAFVLRARDHAPRHADQDAFVPGDDGWDAVVALEPGWGCCVDVHDADGAPVADVRVLAGDELLATTDARGHADPAAPERPAALRFAHPDRTVVGGDLDPATGRLPARVVWELNVVVAPAPARDERR